MKKLKPTPHFKTEREERAFWQRVDSTEYVDYSNIERWVFPNLKLSSIPVTIRLPESLIMCAKLRAHQQDIPYQSLIKQWIFKGAALG